MSHDKSKLQTIVAFDFGTKRIGSAVGKYITKTARPLSTIQNKEGQIDWQTIQKIVNEWRPDGFVVGIPLNMDGSEQSITQDAREFAKVLQIKFDLPVFESDERLTTKSARELVFEQGGYKALQATELDSVAAMLILEQWFNAQE